MKSFPYQTEFPGFKMSPEIDRMIEVGTLLDQSWHNDACPSFSRNWDGDDEDAPRLWVFEEDPLERDPSGGVKRYAVTFKTEGRSDYFETDDLIRAVGRLMSCDANIGILPPAKYGWGGGVVETRGTLAP